MKSIKSLAAVGIIALVFSAVGCGKVADKVAEKGVEKGLQKSLGASDVDIDDDGFSIETDDGEFSTKIGDDIPDGWPENFAIPDGFTVEGSNTTSAGDEGRTMMVMATGTGDPKAAYQHYLSWAESEGYEILQQTEHAGDSYMGTVRFQFTADGPMGSAMVTSSGGDEVELMLNVLEIND